MCRSVLLHVSVWCAFCACVLRSGQERESRRCVGCGERVRAAVRTSGEQLGLSGGLARESEDVVGGFGVAEQEPLSEATSEVFEHGELFGGLDAFGDDSRPRVWPRPMIAAASAFALVWTPSSLTSAATKVRSILRKSMGRRWRFISRSGVAAISRLPSELRRQSVHTHLGVLVVRPWSDARVFDSAECRGRVP